MIVSQNSFEHFLEPLTILEDMRDALAPEGKIFITFASPWYAPYGAHMMHFSRLPWIQLFFSERTIMEVRSRYRTDGAKTFRDAGLAEMTLKKFKRTVHASGLRCVWQKYDCSWGQQWLQYTPLRELFVNRVSCILTH
jgi:hypothetical protein